MTAITVSPQYKQCNIFSRGKHCTLFPFSSHIFHPQPRTFSYFLTLFLSLRNIVQVLSWGTYIYSHKLSHIVTCFHIFLTRYHTFSNFSHILKNFHILSHAFTHSLTHSHKISQILMHFLSHLNSTSLNAKLPGNQNH